MPAPIIYGIFVLTTWAINAMRAASVARSVWHAMTLARVHTQSLGAVRMVGERMVQFSYKSAKYTVKATRSGELTVKALNGKAIPREVADYLQKTILPRSSSFRGLYQGGAKGASRKADLEMLIKVGS